MDDEYITWEGMLGLREPEDTPLVQAAVRARARPQIQSFEKITRQLRKDPLLKKMGELFVGKASPDDLHEEAPNNA